MDNDKYINIKIKRMTSAENNNTYDDFKIQINSPTNILDLLRTIFKDYDSSVTFYLKSLKKTPSESLV